ncbi:hypothetical protein AMTRI_Chr02g253700 [Amborella trichopoda]
MNPPLEREPCLSSWSSLQINSFTFLLDWLLISKKALMVDHIQRGGIHFTDIYKCIMYKTKLGINWASWISICAWRLKLVMNFSRFACVMLLFLCFVSSFVFPLVSTSHKHHLKEKEMSNEESEGKLKGILGYIEDDMVSINFVVDCRFVSACCSGEGIVSRLPCDILLFVSYFLGFYILILY